MLLCADVHGARSALARVAALGEPLLILGEQGTVHPDEWLGRAR